MSHGSSKQGKGGKNFSQLFLALVAVLYLILLILQPQQALTALTFTKNIALRILPVFSLVILIMFAVDYLLSPAKVAQWVGDSSGVKGYLIAIAAGILSHGAIFVWYSLLQEMKDKGMRSGLIAVFLYNRAIKLTLLPLLIFYLGFEYALVLSFYMVLASLLQGALIEYTSA